MTSNNPVFVCLMKSDRSGVTRKGERKRGRREGREWDAGGEREREVWKVMGRGEASAEGNDKRGKEEQKRCMRRGGGRKAPC